MEKLSPRVSLMVRTSKLPADYLNGCEKIVQGLELTPIHVSSAVTDLTKAADRTNEQPAATDEITRLQVLFYCRGLIQERRLLFGCLAYQPGRNRAQHIWSNKGSGQQNMAARE
jgi:hypothetical protein